MKSESRHVIHKQIIEVSIEDETRAHDIQSKISDLCNNILPDRFEKICNQMDLDGNLLYIPRLEIDLSKIPPDHWEDEFVIRCEKIFYQELKGKKHLKKNGKYSAISGFPEPEEGVYLSGKSKSLDFFYFIQTGQIRFQSGLTDFEEFEKILIEWLEENPSERENFLEQWLTVYRSDAKILNRLILQFSERFIKGLTQLLWGFSEDEHLRLVETFEKLLKDYTEEDFADSAQRKMLYYGILVKILCHGEKKPDSQSIEIQFIEHFHAFCGADNDKLDDISRLNINKTGSATEKEERDTENPENPNYISNAGLVIAAPFLTSIFKQLEYISEKEFKSERLQERAVHLTQYLVDGSEQTGEFSLLLNKTLCGWPANKSLSREIMLTDEEKAEAESLLNSIVKNWKKIGNASVAALRETFLQRYGKLQYQVSSGTWLLHVEHKGGIDILVERLPWTISVIKLPWMKESVFVEWV